MKWILLGLLFILCFVIWLVLSNKPSKRVYNGKEAEAKERGKQGEKKVRAAIGETQEGFKYVLNDYILDIPTEVGTTQIDHIVINSYGVFVIETKNYSGKIVGKDDEEVWHQYLCKGKLCYNLNNPVKQNENHIRHLTNVLPYGTRIYSVVVFVKNNTKYIESKYVYNLRDIDRALIKDKPRYKWRQISKFGKILEDNRSFATSSEHTENIKKVEN